MFAEQWFLSPQQRPSRPPATGMPPGYLVRIALLRGNTRSSDRVREVLPGGACRAVQEGHKALQEGHKAPPRAFISLSRPHTAHWMRAVW
jgi:hypothetical protein